MAAAQNSGAAFRHRARKKQEAAAAGTRLSSAKAVRCMGMAWQNISAARLSTSSRQKNSEGKSVPRV